MKDIVYDKYPVFNDAVCGDCHYFKEKRSFIGVCSCTQSKWVWKKVIIKHPLLKRVHIFGKYVPRYFDVVLHNEIACCRYENTVNI